MLSELFQVYYCHLNMTLHSQILFQGIIVQVSNIDIFWTIYLLCASSLSFCFYSFNPFPFFFLKPLSFSIAKWVFNKSTIIPAENCLIKCQCVQLGKLQWKLELSATSKFIILYKTGVFFCKELTINSSLTLWTILFYQE